MKKITDKKTGETFIGEVWLAEVKNGTRTLKVEITDEMDVERYDIEDIPGEKKYGGRVPEKGDEFWCVSSDGYINEVTWEGIEWDKDRFESGSAFWTREEAEKELKRRKAYVVLKEDTKGFAPSADSHGACYNVYCSLCNHALYIEHQDAWIARGTLCFATYKDAKDSIEAHRQFWLDYLGVEEEE